MKNPYILSLVIFTFLSLCAVPVVLWSQENPSSQESLPSETKPDANKEVPTQDEEAVRLIKEARSRLFLHKSVQADISQRVSLGEYHFLSSGKYLAGEEFKSRIEYDVKLGKLEGSFLEVCDGQVLHSRRQIREVQNLSSKPEPPTIELARRDINKILRETQLYLDQPEAVRAAEIGIGGLPAILASLERSMIFDSVQEKLEAEMPVYVVQGVWNPAEEARLAAGLQGLSGQIMQFLPERVLITLNKETLFPQKFQYLKELPEQKGVFKPLLTVNFDNAVLNQPVPAHRFSYIPPPGMEERDETAMFIEAIKLGATSSPESNKVEE